MMNEYKTVISNQPEELEQSVANFLNQGWRCQGGVTTTLGGKLVQAMVRKKPVKA